MFFYSHAYCCDHQGRSSRMPSVFLWHRRRDCSLVSIWHVFLVLINLSFLLASVMKFLTLYRKIMVFLPRGFRQVPILSSGHWKDCLTPIQLCTSPAVTCNVYIIIIPSLWIITFLPRISIFMVVLQVLSKQFFGDLIPQVFLPRLFTLLFIFYISSLHTYPLLSTH